MTRLNVVGENEAAATAPSTSTNDQAALKLLLLSLQTVSQRALIALSNMFTLIGLASAWWLWHETLPNPSISQLTGLALYGLLLVSLHLVRRK